MSRLTAQELLAGAGLTYDIDVPDEVLNGGPTGRGPQSVQLRPLTVGDLQRITRAARDSDSLVAALMVQQALVEPELSVAQVAGLPVGLLQFLLLHVNRVSGIDATPSEAGLAAKDPLVRASLVLSRELGWTPHQISELSMGQVLLHIRMLEEQRAGA